MPGTTTVFTTRAAPSGNAPAPPLQPRQWLSLPTGTLSFPESHNQKHTACGPLDISASPALPVFSTSQPTPPPLAPSSGPRPGGTYSWTPGSAPSLVKPMGRLLGSGSRQSVPLCPGKPPVGEGSAGWSRAGQLLQLLWLRSLSGKTPSGRGLPGHRAVPHSC